RGRCERCNLTLVIYPFSFCWFHAHLDLHSFPTRRSSDLVFPNIVKESGRLRDFGAVSPAAEEPQVIGSIRPTHWSPPRPRNIPRSEEHTSELQSPCNLVCRLLLEKKKPIRIIVPGRVYRR